MDGTCGPVGPSHPVSASGGKVPSTRCPWGGFWGVAYTVGTVGEETSVEGETRSVTFKGTR